MIACFCCVKKRGELFLLKNPHLFYQKLKMSDENIEMGEIGNNQSGNEMETEIGVSHARIENESDNLRRRSSTDTVMQAIPEERASLPYLDDNGHCQWI